MHGSASEDNIRSGRIELNRTRTVRRSRAPGGGPGVEQRPDRAGSAAAPGETGADGPVRPALRAAVAVAAALLLAASPAAAQGGPGGGGPGPLPQDTAGREVAGLRLGSWDVQGLERRAEASYSTIPVFDAFYQRSLGRSTELQLGLGLWRRGRVSGAGTIGMWVAPVFGGIKYYPVGGPEGRFDPYLSLAGGPALGFEERRSSGFGGLESGWTAAVGAGAEGGAGVELRLSEQVGLTADVQYQWVRYLAGEMDGPVEYRGAVFGAGVTYRLDLR